jgi:hypothetical protein
MDRSYCPETQPLFSKASPLLTAMVASKRLAHSPANDVIIASKEGMGCRQ